MTKLTTYSSRFKAFCKGALHSVEEDEASDSTVNPDGTFRFGRAAAYMYVLQSNHSVSYSTINSLYSKSKEFPCCTRVT